MKDKLVDELVKYFSLENERVYKIPESYEGKRLFLRRLINIREAMPLDEEILEKEDNLLKLELKEKKLVKASDFKDKVSLYKGDIATIKCDAIVNACNEYLLGCFIPNHSCIDNQIHTFAGIRLRLKCNDIMKGDTLESGKVILTSGYNLPCKYIIHTVGPKVQGVLTKENEDELKACYVNSLELAKENNIRSIVFPCISTGVYRYPKDKAASLAYKTVKDYLKDNDKYFDKIIFNVFKDEDEMIYERLFEDKEINR